VNDFIENMINYFKRSKGIGEYIFYKLQLIKVIHGQIGIIDVIKHSDISNRYKDNLDNLIRKLNHKEESSYLDLKLEKKYGLFRSNINVIELLVSVYSDMVKIFNK
jgi:hypothetical protein